MTIGEITLRAVLASLAAYHLGIGLLSVASLRATARVTRLAYGLVLDDTPQLAHAVRMLGLYALTLGLLLGLAAWSPHEHRDVIAVVAGLQILRALSRIGYRRELGSLFSISARRNAFNAAMLVLEAMVLIVFFPGT